MTWYELKHWYKNNRAETWIIVAGVSVLALLIGAVVWAISPETQKSTVVLAPVKVEEPAPAQVDPPKVYDYNPPAIEVEYRKDFAEGEIQEVKFNGDGPYTEEKLLDKPLPHYVPDWTDVTYLPPWDDAQEVTLQFCGNVLNKFDPHTKIKMILHATNVGDYNDCYKSGAPLTFGGKPTPPSNIVKPSVPGVMK
jgi:hypothetical protein